MGTFNASDAFRSRKFGTFNLAPNRYSSIGSLCVPLLLLSRPSFVLGQHIRLGTVGERTFFFGVCLVFWISCMIFLLSLINGLASVLVEPPFSSSISAFLQKKYPIGSFGKVDTRGMLCLK